MPADDYLVLPIKLEASKNYNVTVNAANSGYPEKFEVKVGKEATVEGLSTVAIAETEVSSADFSDFSGSFSTDEAGTYYVAIHATSDADQFRLKVKTLTIEVGAAGNAPAAVTDLTVTPTENKIEATIVFDAPSVTIDGNEMTENLTKIDVLRDGVVIESVADVAPGSERTIVDNEEKGLTIGTHKYQVIPYNANGIGQKSEEVSVLITAALSVPYTFDLTKDQTGLFTIIDNNEDGKTWSFSSSVGTMYSYDSTNPGDDYLVSPVFNLEGGKNYKVVVNAKSYNANYTERFEVKVGKVATAEGLNITAIGPTDVSSTEADDFEGEFTVDEAGEYFIAIHAISEPNNWRLVVNTLTVEKGIDPTAPAAPELTVTAGEEGALEANVRIVAPTKTIGGDDLTRLCKRLQGRPRTYRLEDFETIWEKIPDEIFIFYGANDTKAPWRTDYKVPITPPELEHELLQGILEQLRRHAPEAGVTFIASPPGFFPYQEERNRRLREIGAQHSLFNMPEHVLAYNRVMRKFAAGNGCTYLDFHRECARHPDPKSLFIPDDGVHMTLKGHLTLAAFLLRYLEGRFPARK